MWRGRRAPVEWVVSMLAVRVAQAREERRRTLETPGRIVRRSGGGGVKVHLNGLVRRRVDGSDRKIKPVVVWLEVPD